MHDENRVKFEKAGDGADWCLRALERYESEAAVDPLTNSVRRLAYDLSRGGEEGALSHDMLAAIAKTFCDAALIDRADAFAASRRGAAADPDTLVADILKPLEGAPFERVAEALERGRAGVVFTAHPTFAMSRALRAAFAARVEAADERAGADAAARVARLAHAPDPALSLDDEHADAQAALLRAQDALDALTRAMLRWARARFPAQWTALVPAPLSLATWVGYDLDGRTDIHWGQTFRIRLAEKALQLSRYVEKLKAARFAAPSPARDRLVARLDAAAALTREQADLFDIDFEDAAAVTRAANRLTADDPRRLVSLEPVIAALGEMIAAADADEARLDLCALRASMRGLGLGIGRIHLRINAAQVRSALRADLGLEAGRAFIDRTAFEAAAEKARGVAQKRVNIASIFLEQMTARRQLMLCAQFLKHVDADTPIRFLIAEIEAPATMMGAVYLARLYGVADRLDISPLFETPDAIERGGRFMERLLAEKEFVEYIRMRGRVAIQLGFSDSGRFMGQIAANFAIERLQILLSRAMAAQNVRDVDVVVFNTHGESMGRGCFQGTLAERFDYLMTPWARARYRHDGLWANAEASFQGGDGYLHFETDRLAAQTMAGLLRWSFAEPVADREDRYYADINYSWDLYRGVKAWQEALFENADYQASVGAFAPNMLFVTGSRKVRRQSGAAVTGPRSLRAIPHNAILQQLAAPANVSGGVGAAAGAERERILELAAASPRFRQALAMVRRARALTSLPATRSYGVLFDAAFWISKAGPRAGAKNPAACEELAQHLAQKSTPVALSRLANLLAADTAHLDRILYALDAGEGVAERRARRRPMHALHAIRQAMIMRAFLLVADLPSFSQRHDVSRASIFDLAFQLRLDELADLLDDIFPAANADAAALSGVDEPADDPGDVVRGYPEIQANVIAPLREIAQSIREIGVGLSHFYGAYG